MAVNRTISTAFTPAAITSLCSACGPPPDGCSRPPTTSNCSGVAVLSYGFWQSHYAGAESAVGSPIRLNGHAFPIVGVAQRGFFGTDVGEKLDVAIPICAEA